MPRTRPAASGYARIAQAEAEESDYHDESGDERANVPLSKASATDALYESIQPGGRTAGMSRSAATSSRGRRHRRPRTNSGVDIKAINARLERWAEEIASKFKLRKIKGKSADEEHLEIHHSVFQAPDGIRPADAESLAARFADRPDSERITKLQFDDIVESVKVAIELGIHPKMITQGSSGSYFARNSDGKTVGVFKPKDEEPYASRNPKWTKWIHRNLFPFFFGRACLIPNLSYVSEAAAYILDTRLQTDLVPYTDIVHLSSVSFFYDFWERRAYYRHKKPFPHKVGSFQVFLKGFKDANIFLREHPWPDQLTANLPATSADKRQRRGWTDSCRTTTADDEEDEEEMSSTPGRSESQRRRAFWSEELQVSFREQLEKLVILDYIMRNTDRGLDNWMIRIDEETQTASIVADFPQDATEPHARQDAMGMGQHTDSHLPTRQAKVGAIDNSLSWPWKHPDAVSLHPLPEFPSTFEKCSSNSVQWRSFPFGWLFLPVSLIGRPFSERTRQHFLPLLTSKQWWSETQVALRKCFSQDADFQERMFARQIAVMKGQAWNVVETLKTPDHGPLELTRRARVCVWDDLVEIPTVVPLRPSSEIRRQHDGAAEAQRHELDIGAANGLTPEVLTPNRFNLSRHGSNEAVPNGLAAADLDSRLLKAERPPSAPRSKTRFSLDEARPVRPDRNRARRNLSFSTRRLSIDAEDDAGDLGYGAARDMEGNRKKVIVERLEMVTGKPPVFTWC